MRVGLSPLRYHKKCHNFIDTPSDRCSCDRRPEDINHFLFSCPLYAACRLTLTTDVIKILQKYNLNHLQNQSHLYLSISTKSRFSKSISICMCVNFSRKENTLKEKKKSPARFLSVINFVKYLTILGILQLPNIYCVRRATKFAGFDALPPRGGEGVNLLPVPISQ